MEKILIYSNNFIGKQAQITYYPDIGGALDLGVQTIPYEYSTNYYYGNYVLYFPEFDETCEIYFQAPTPTPTPTRSTPTPTPTFVSLEGSCFENWELENGYLTMATITGENGAVIQGTGTNWGWHGNITISNYYRYPGSVYQGPLTGPSFSLSTSSSSVDTTDLGFSIGEIVTISNANNGLSPTAPQYTSFQVLNGSYRIRAIMDGYYYLSCIEDSITPTPTPLIECSSSISVQDTPVSLVVQESIDKCFVANYEDNTISVIDTNSKAVLTNISVYRPSGYQLTKPYDIVLHNSLNKIYVTFNGGNDSVFAPTHQWSSGVVVINTITHEVIKIIDIWKPSHLAISESRNSVYCSSKDTVTNINSIMLIDTILDERPQGTGIALDESSTNYQLDSYKIQVNGLAVNEFSSELCALVQLTNQGYVFYFDIEEGFSLITGNGYPLRTIITNTGSYVKGIACNLNKVYVTVTNRLEVIDISDPSTRGYGLSDFPSYSATNAAGSSSNRLYAKNSDNLIYIPSKYSNQIVVVRDIGQYAFVQKVISAGTQPEDVFVTSENEIYVANSGDDEVQIIKEACHYSIVPTPTPSIGTSPVITILEQPTSYSLDESRGFFKVRVETSNNSFPTFTWQIQENGEGNFKNYVTNPNPYKYGSTFESSIRNSLSTTAPTSYIESLLLDRYRVVISLPGAQSVTTDVFRFTFSGLGRGPNSISSGATWNGVTENLTTVGTNGGSSYYGTHEQGGQVNEWNDETATINGTVQKVVRGGRFIVTQSNGNEIMRGSNINDRSFENPNYTGEYMGFRLSSIFDILNYSSIVSGANEFLIVGDPGNNSFTNYTVNNIISPIPYEFNFIGRVDYQYRIMKYPVTNAEYVIFLNSVDPNGTNTRNLYDVQMSSGSRGGINFNSSNSSGFKYFSKTNMSNKPVNYISWFRAARFSNWLHNKASNSNVSGDAATETGAYTLNGNVIVEANQNCLYRIPTEHEWVKAAYYKGPRPEGYRSDYWLYPTRYNTTPYIAQANSVGDGIINEFAYY